VAAQSENFSIIYQGKEALVDGTSCASPSFAAFVSMLNDARINAQKTPLGFLNPFLYSTGYKALNDITYGNNPGCGTLGFNVGRVFAPSNHITNVILVYRLLLDGILVSFMKANEVMTCL
jgi:subtilase family serine protease